MDHEVAIGNQTIQQSQHEHLSELPLAAPRSDPPGYAVPQVRQMEWWLYRHHLEHQKTLDVDAAKRRPLPAPLQAPTHKPSVPNVTHDDPRHSHSYKEYIRARRKNRGRDMDESDSETIFSWVPPGRGLGESSPNGKPSNYRSQAAQQVFDSAVPKRSWSIDNDDEKDEQLTRSKQTVITSFDDSSWVMPRPTTKRDDEQGQNLGGKEIFDDEEEIIDEEEEVLVDDDGNTIEEEEFSEEEVTVIDDGLEIIEQEVSASSLSATSNHSMLPSSETPSSRKPSSFMPPRSPNKASSVSSRFLAAQLARDESVSSSMSSSHSSSHSSSRPSSNTVTEDSGSTQVIYIRDPRDLDEIVQKCFDGGRNVRIVDDPDPPSDTDDDSEFVPSKRLLIVLCLLVALVAVSIILGVSIYFKK